MKIALYAPLSFDHSNSSAAFLITAPQYSSPPLVLSLNSSSETLSRSVGQRHAVA